MGGMNDSPSLRSRHTVTRLFVHLVWATRGRFAWLEPDVDPWLARLMFAKCIELGSKLLAVGNGADHVHVLVSHPPTLAVATLAQRLKGASSYVLAPRLPREFGWQEGYFAESVRDLPRLAAYVRQQRGHHADGRGAPEAWEESVLPAPEGDR
jgi:putative transposase